ncbi:hypothetical protein AAE478_001503 [Parahypoxylon ruwenzoriense]
MPPSIDPGHQVATTSKKRMTKNEKSLQRACERLEATPIGPNKYPKYLLPGMSHGLFPHQLLAVDVMVDYENAPYQKGGINADEMGLGKTVETIGCMMVHRPSPADVQEELRTTIWVIPKSARAQLIDALKKFYNGQEGEEPNILTYNKKHLDTEYGDQALAHLKKQDIIIATYQDITSNVPNEVNAEIMKEDRRLAGPLPDDIRQKLGLLFRMKFFRVILDEAHYIRNHKTKEFYSYLSFLRVNGVKSFGLFKSNYMDVLGGVLDCVMIRRTQEENLLGRPLLSLPPTNRSKMVVDLDRGEGEIYEALRDCFRGYAKAPVGSPEAPKKKKPYTYFLRLREAASHPFLLEYMMLHEDEKETLSKIVSNLKDQGGQNQNVDMIQGWYREEEDRKAQEFCGCCSAKAVNPLQLPMCGHNFCLECIQNYEMAEKKKRMKLRCPQCQKRFESVANIDIDALRGLQAQRGLHGGRDVHNQEPRLSIQSKSLADYDRSSVEAIMTSAKMRAVRATVTNWLTQAPKDKIVIFTQYMMCGCIVGRILRELDIKFLYYFGDMTENNQEKAIREFKRRLDIKVLNQALEDQAFGRVYRIGQRKETHLLRIVAKNTIDEKIVSVQEAKLSNIAGALNEELMIDDKITFSQEEMDEMLAQLEQH